MRLISSSVTRIVIPCLLVNIRGCLHIGNQHLLHPVEDEVPLHPTNWVITWRDIQLGKDRVFKENFCLIHKTHHKARGGNVDGGVHYLFDFPYLLSDWDIANWSCIVWWTTFMTMLFHVWRGLIWARTMKGPSMNLTNFTLSSNKGAPPVPIPAYCVGRDLGNSLLRSSSMEQQMNWGFQLPTLYHHGFLRSFYTLMI